MAVRIHRIETGKWKENTYIVSDADFNAVIVDPGEDLQEIQAYIEKEKLIIQGIVNTHGHFDHVASVADLKEIYKVPFFLHSGDFKLLRAANFYRKIFEGGELIRIPQVDHDLKDQDSVAIGPLKFEVLPTPGHTEGGVCLKIENKLFTGDNILGKKIGRTDLPGGDPLKLEETIVRICALPPETEIYPGHGPMVTLAEILSTNPEIIVFKSNSMGGAQ